MLFSKEDAVPSPCNASVESQFVIRNGVGDIRSSVAVAYRLHGIRKKRYHWFKEAKDPDPAKHKQELTTMK